VVPVELIYAWLRGRGLPRHFDHGGRVQPHQPGDHADGDAAILTLIGYSMNDTIVVFDRIRENLALSRARR